MKLLDLTLESAALNLALDEALLTTADQCELRHADTETLRIWEPVSPMLVLGRSSKYLLEAKPVLCKQRGVEIVRRGSGGAAVVSGPGCLMFSLVLSLEKRPQLRDVEAAHQFVLNPLAESLSTALSTALGEATVVTRQGTSDLVAAERKFSGNSLRLARRHLLYHGTLLYNMDLSLLSCLGTPPRQPVYRQGRDHAAFVANITLSKSGFLLLLIRFLRR
jgi:lipoate-protein ligase A